MSQLLRLFVALALCGTAASSLAYRYTGLANNVIFSGAGPSDLQSKPPRLHADVAQGLSGMPPFLSFDAVTCGPGLSCTTAEMSILTQAKTAATNRWNAVNNGVVIEAASSQLTLDPCSQDGNQVIGYASNSCGSSGWPAGLLGIATTHFQSLSTAGAITEIDIAINPNPNWGSFDGNFNQAGQTDLNRVLLHEMGHTIGLDHPDEYGQSVSAIMNSSANNNFALQADDVQGDQDLAAAISSTSTNTKGGLVGGAGYSIANAQVNITASACFLERYFLESTSLPDGEVALVLTKTNDVNETGRHITGNSGPRANDNSTFGAFDRNLNCPQKQFSGPFVQPHEAGNYFQHLGFFLLDGSLIDYFTFDGQQFFNGGGPSPTPASTSTPSPTTTASPTLTPMPSATASASPTPTPTSRPSPTPSAAPSASPQATVSPSASPSPSSSPTATPTPRPSATPTSGPSQTPTPTPFASATQTPVPTPSPSISPSFTPPPTATPSASPIPSIPPSAEPDLTPTPTTPSPSPTETGNPEPNATPMPIPDGNDSLANAQQIEVDGNPAIQAEISSRTDIDIYAFELTERREMEFRSTGGTDVMAILKDANGDLITSNDDAEAKANNFLIKALLEPGQYYLEVSGAMNATGPYELIVSSTQATNAASGGGSGAISIWMLCLLVVLTGIAVNMRENPRRPERPSPRL